MESLPFLKTGKKPAPGELALLQGLINTSDVESGTDDLSGPTELRIWLVRAGLLPQSAVITDQDYKTLISFRELIRRLLAAHHASPTEVDPTADLNQLVDGCNLVIRFHTDGDVTFEPIGAGIDSVIGRYLAIIVRASLNGTWMRLKVCEESSCRWAFYDASKNHSGRWCSMSVCGSRTKARQYRKRRAQRS